MGIQHHFVVWECSIILCFGNKASFCVMGIKHHFVAWEYSIIMVERSGRVVKVVDCESTGRGFESGSSPRWRHL